MANRLMDPSNLREWFDTIHLDFSNPYSLAHSFGDWLADAPTGVLVAAAAAVVATLALTRKPGTAVLIVLAALGALGVVGWAL